MNDGLAGIERERSLEVLNGTRVFGSRERGAPQSHERGDRLRRIGQRALEQQLRGFRTSLIEIRVAKPDKRGDIARLDLNGPFECGR